MAQDFLEPPAYGLHDVYRALSILAKESDLIQVDCYKNSSFLYNRDSPNPIVQMGLFMDRDGIPLAFSVFPGNENEDINELYYKEIPYISGDIDQLLIITYSPKFAEYQKRIRDAQVERAEAMIKSGKLKKTAGILMTQPGLSKNWPLPMTEKRQTSSTIWTKTKLQTKKF